MKQTVAVLGLGNMGGQFARALSSRDHLQVIGIDPNEEKRHELSSQVDVLDSVAQLPEQIDALILAIKPQQLADLVTEHPQLPDRVADIPLISMLAGTTVDRLRSFFPNSPVTRIMPNLAVSTGSGIVLVYATPESDHPIGFEALQDWFASMGIVFGCTSEQQLDQLTGIFGSGPAYVYLLGELLAAQAQSYGVSADEAQQLVTTLFTGSLQYAAAADHPLNQLRQNVTSKGGVTEAVLRSWQNDNLSEIISTGLTAGYQRAQELSS